MRISSTFVYIALYLGFVAAAAMPALTPEQVVTNVGIVTTVSGDLNALLGDLTSDQ
ncbi:hypothetical protein OG21DRAFT_1511712 [Imleria badia]|nr:hypothetical protein OG21DRAFT_1511712 [Imleria badia]